MNKHITWIIISLSVLVLIAGCTEKKNLVGNQDSDLHPIVITFDHTNLLNTFAYQDTMKNNGAGGSFSVGNLGDVNAYGLLYFEDLGDSVIVDSAKLRLVVEDHSIDEAQTMNVAKVMQAWTEYDVTWEERQGSVPWDETRWEYLDVTFSTGDNDTLAVDIPVDLVQSWVDGDTTNYGLMIDSDQDGVIQFHSQEGSYEPRLEIYYTEDDTTVSSRTVYVTEDAYICYSEMEEGQIPVEYIGNVSPTRLYMKWDMTYDAFCAAVDAAYPDGSQSFVDTLEWRRTTINRAEIIVKVDSTQSWIPEDAFNVYGYILRDTVAIDSLPFVSSNLKSYSYTDVSAYEDGEIAVDVTPLVQAFVADVDENCGFVVKSLSEYYTLGRLYLPAFTTEVKMRMVVTKPLIGDLE